ncbi:Uncharacterized protein DAT39_004874, partial [Clarias magur]
MLKAIGAAGRLDQHCINPVTPEYVKDFKRTHFKTSGTLGQKVSEDSKDKWWD